MASIMTRKRRARISPTYMVFMWFGSFILTGTVLLWLPWAHVDSVKGFTVVDALFTAVSAACVTGLSVVNVADTFSFFGQFVIFLLMEMGGMGIMSFASLGFRILGRRLSMQQQAATANAFFQNDAASEFKQTFMAIFRITALIQAAGALGMGIALAPHHWESDPWFCVWSAIFHSASAFCNSGFTLYRDGLSGFLTNYPFLALILVLVTLGGLGHIVLNELYRLPGELRRRAHKPRYISLHTRVVLSMTALLIAVGVLFIYCLGSGDEKTTLWQAVFETISGRTAGFSIQAQSRLPLPTILVMLLLMFIGGSPGSCAGGIKTTSLAIWAARIRANLRNDSNVNMFGYTIAPELVSRARILMAVTVIWNIVGVFILSITNPGQDLQTLMFEQISAFGTVGLSMDFTPELTTAARLWVIVSMFVGRLGPLSIALWVVRPSRVKINQPIGRVMIG